MGVEASIARVIASCGREAHIENTASVVDLAQHSLALGLDVFEPRRLCLATGRTIPEARVRMSLQHRRDLVMVWPGGSRTSCKRPITLFFLS